MKTLMLPLNKIKSAAIKMPMILAEHAFLTFLVLLFFSLILGGFLYYNYDVSFKKTGAQTDVVIKHLKFKEDAYKSILDAENERGSNFRGADSRKYLNPFQTPNAATSTPLMP